ncbi:MAG: carboxymuconolactone decarboxylase family protein [bacterium]
MKRSLIEERLPDVWKPYISMVKEIMKDGALSTKVKELIATALSIAVHCEPCIKVHIKRAVENGATKDEVAETLAVTLLMCGGPSDVWTRRVIEEIVNECFEK